MSTILKEILRFKEKSPSTEIVLAYIKEVFNRNPSMLRYEKGKPYIYFEYTLDDDESPIDKLENDLHYIIRNIPMEEHDPNDSSPHKIVIDMFRAIETRKLAVSHIVCGNKKNLLLWLGLLDPQQELLFDTAAEHTLLNIKLIQFSEIPDDSFILCGAIAKYAQPSEIVFALKGTID